VDNNPKPAEIVILASGAVIFVFSFFKWLEFGPISRSAWGDGLFPLLTLPALLGLIMAVQIALDRFANVDFPAEIGGFTWKQIHLVLAAVAFIILLFYLFTDKGEGLDLAFGFWLSLLASIGLVAGAVMLYVDTGAGTTGGGGTTPPPPPQQF
jgi:hypothetical protein